ncbi:hypothetical protein [Chryseobacterium nepalense]|uniref:Phage abortive infection protein n=1 Tax=Chryseobacterium nepalense TaxID=1854498 RepID=A0ABY4K8J3_9FLAO|nr:hypothetical protein [Chryseobacterium nepalense]UPQ77088.1 hypothetical protein M0D58_05895 [Chryseobacterium nepalense]
MINFLPVIYDDFDFSPLFVHYSTADMYSGNDVNFTQYPFSRFRYFFWEKKRLPAFLQIDETQIERFDMFKNIFTRGDYFYLIAYQYFNHVKDYGFEYKVEGRMKIELNGSLKTISFFEPLYNALIEEKNRCQILLRHEYILLKNKHSYTNKLTQLLIDDYYDLDDAIRKEKNVFAKYGIVIKEVYLQIFRDFYSNFADYLSNENFEILKKLVYPSKKEVQSFKLATRNNYRNLKDMDARFQIISSIQRSLIDRGFIADTTTYEQINDLFNNKRRELHKIIWLKNVTALHTFYKVMEEDKIIQDSEGEHWKILSDYFILTKDSEITKDELKGKKRSTNLNMVDELRDIFSFLKKIVA